ncbi:MAG: hypothetical protein U0176_13395 [Bacteroidia bacterium]
MDLQEKDIALLEAYLAGELAGEERAALEARLAAEPELRETMAMMREMEGATAVTARSTVKKDLKAAKAAAVAAGMASYSPSINPPKTGGGFGKRLFNFLLTMAILGGGGWAVWKYVLHEQWPPNLSQSTVKTETKTTKTVIKRDTIHMDHKVKVQPGGE